MRKPNGWPFLVALLNTAACRSSSGSSGGPCEELLACCRMLSAEAKSQCESAYTEYHSRSGADEECQVALDSIEQIGGCMQDESVGPNGVELALNDYNDAERRAMVAFKNLSAVNLPLYQEYFSLTLADGAVLSGDETLYGEECHVNIAPSAQLTCQVRFYDPNLRQTPGVQVSYQHLQYSASVQIEKAECALGPENTLAACTDGCNNDADDVSWVDCDDRDCCAVLNENVRICGTQTFCGR